MAKDPSFPFYASDWLGSTNVALMDAEQERGYLRLLCHAWNSGECALEDDDETLAKLSLMGQRWFNGGSTLVKRCFNEHPTKPGFLTNTRLLEVWEAREEHRKQRSLAGTKSAQSRKNQRNGNERSTSVATDVPTEPQRDGNLPFPLPFPSPVNTSSKEEVCAPTKRFVKPSVEEVKAYCESIAASIDCERFVDFYASKGWRVGDAPMKDWRAAVRNWSRDKSHDHKQPRGVAQL